MAQYVAAGVGAFIGFFLGGPAGAAIGFSIGLGVGMSFQEINIPGPKLGEITRVTTNEGAPRIVPFGKVRPIGCQLLAMDEPNIVTTTVEQGGKGGPSITSSYDTVYRTYALGICEGPIHKILRIWRNNKLVYDNRGTDWGAENNAAFLAKATLYLGGWDQMPDPTLETIYGAGEVPGYRGTAYIVVNQDDVTDLGGAVPQYLFEVLRKSFEERETEPEELSLYVTTSTWQSGSTPGQIYHLNPITKGLTPIGGTIRNWRGICHTPFGEIFAVEGNGANKIWKGDKNGNFEEFYNCDGGGGAWSLCCDYKGTIYAPAQTKADSTTIKLYISEYDEEVGRLPFVEHTLTCDSEFVWDCRGCYCKADGTLLMGRQDYATNATIYNRSLSIAYECFADGGVCPIIVPTAGINKNVLAAEGPTWSTQPSCIKDMVTCTNYVNNGAEPFWSGLCQTDNNGTIYACNHGNSFRGVIGWIEKDNDGNRSFSNIGAANGPYQSITSNFNPFAKETIAYFGSETWLLSEVLTAICNQAGIETSSLNFDLLEDKNVYGFSYSKAHPSYTSIEALARVYLFDVSNFDGKLNFITRGMDITDEITIDELIDDGRNIIARDERRDEIIVPRVMHLKYYDIDGGLNPDQQSSERSQTGKSVSEVVVQSTVIMDADQAAAAVVVNHKIGIEESKNGFEFSLGDNYLRLVPGQVVSLDGERLRINEIQIDDGFQKYRTSRDRQSAYDLTNVSGIPVESPGDPPGQIVGYTTFHFIDSHILQDADDDLGFYVAFNGAGESWKGAIIEYSLDGGANYIEGQIASSNCTIGTLLSDLPDHSQYYPDGINTISVELLTEEMALYSSDLEGMMNRENLAIIGTEDSAGMRDEIINFANAEQESDGSWTLSNLLRGRKGSQTAEHSAGERFILLDRSKMFFVPTDTTLINQEITFRTTSIGSSQYQTIETHTFKGLSQTERQPAYLKATRVGGNLIISWQGVGRLGGGTIVHMGSYFKNYRLTINETSINTTAESYTAADPGGDVTISIQQINKLTGAGPALVLNI